MRYLCFISLLLAFYAHLEAASAASTFSFTQCAIDAASEFLAAPNSSFLVASDGTFTSNLSEAWGIRYSACNNLCGPRGGWEPFNWTYFSTSVSSWVLPWLALTAQLPNETRSSFNNLLSLLLAVGSPMLITYSLCLTILNNRWINKYFRGLHDYNEELGRKQVKAIKAARVFLRESQHVPIRIAQNKAEFAQLVVLPENRSWWESLGKEVLKSKRQWTYSLLAQVAWVTVTEIIAIVDFFTSAVNNNTIGLGVAVNTLWIWMIPVTLGWVWVGTQNSASTIRGALMSVEASVGSPPHKLKGHMIGFKDCSDDDSPISRQMDLEANQGAVYPNTLDHTGVNNSGQQDAIEMTDIKIAAEAERHLLIKSTPIKGLPRRMILGFSIAGYALEPGPIFNYARVWNHLRIAEYVGNAFCALNANLKGKRSIQGDAWIEDPHRWKENLQGWHAGKIIANANSPTTSATDTASLAGTSLDQDVSHEVTPSEIEKYVFSRFNTNGGGPPGVTHNFIVAIVVALILQWGTTGSAILIAYQTPMVGLGCESGSYLLFGVLATAAWACLAGSAYLSHKYSVRAAASDGSLSSMDGTTKWAILIVVARFTGKALACINAFWLLAISLLQFTNLYHCCWCTACVLQYGTVEGWVLLWATDVQISDVALNSWVAGVTISCLALLFAGLFFVFMPGEEIFNRPTQ